ncbi:MAG: FGGY-family carbohydrate kinase [Coraliomargaritaceae bacterium]
MIPEIIYVTGGASKNHAIIQILSDIFQVNVQQLEVNGSVALGGAMRAAQHCLGYTLKELESEFCNSSSEMVQPNEYNKEEYLKIENEIKSMLLTL